MRTRSRLYLAMAIVTIILAGCSKPGNEFVGKWRNTKSASNQMEIARNGDNFLIQITEPSLFGGNSQTTVPATLKDGILHVQNGPFAGALTYVHETGRLTTPGLLGGTVEYERVK